MRVNDRIYAVVVTAVLVTASGHALAQPSLSDRETARSQMDEGDKKRDAGDLKGALRNYEMADAIMKVPTTGIEVARTQVAMGQLLEGRETLGRVLRLPVKPGEPAPFTAARKAAEALNTELASRIPSIQIVVTNVEPTQTPQITVDNEPIPAAAANAPRKVNPGMHTVVVKAGSVEKKEDVNVVERDNKTVTIDLRDAAQPPKDPKEQQRAKPPEGDTVQHEGSSTPKLLMYAGFGLAAVGVGVGAVTGLMSISKTNELKDACPRNECPLGKQGDIDSATSLGNISTAAFIVGGVGLGVGVAGLLLSSSSEGAKREASAARPRERTASPFAPEQVRAVLGPSYVGVAGAF
jgi:hypothetical protein